MDHDVRTQPIGERRARDREGCQRLRNQWPILAAGALSTISGVGFAAVAVADDTVHLGMLALYAATGGVFFVIQAGLLARRSHRLPNPPPPCRPEQKCHVGWVSRRLRVRQLPHRSLMASAARRSLSQSIN
jgi:hypothetical protein